MEEARLGWLRLPLSPVGVPLCIYSSHFYNLCPSHQSRVTSSSHAHPDSHHCSVHTLLGVPAFVAPCPRLPRSLSPTSSLSVPDSLALSPRPHRKCDSCLRTVAFVREQLLDVLEEIVQRCVALTDPPLIDQGRCLLWWNTTFCCDLFYRLQDWFAPLVPATL